MMWPRGWPECRGPLSGFIASESSFSSSVLPAVSMAVRSAASVRRLGGRVVLRRASTSTTSCGWPLVPDRKAASGGASGLRLSAFARVEVEDFPAYLLDGGSRGVVAIDDGGIGNRGDDCGHGPDVVFVPGAEQAAADEVVDLAFVGRRAGMVGRSGGGDDGVVVGDLGVVDEAAAQRSLPGAGREVFAIGTLRSILRRF